MASATITYDDKMFGTPITVPLGPAPALREIGDDDKIADICISRSVSCDCPLRVYILIRRDGSVAHWRSQWEEGYNSYWHFDAGTDEWANEHRPTDEQRATLGRIWLGQSVPGIPDGLTGGLGSPVAEWAFAGLTPDDISRRYGDGKAVFLA